MTEDERKEAVKTDEALKKGRTIYDWVDSDGWKESRSLLIQKMVALDSLADIDLSKPEVIKIIAARRLASEILQEWLADIEGTATQYEENAKAMSEIKEDAIIKLFE